MDGSWQHFGGGQRDLPALLALGRHMAPFFAAALPPRHSSILACLPLGRRAVPLLSHWKRIARTWLERGLRQLRGLLVSATLQSMLVTCFSCRRLDS